MNGDATLPQSRPIAALSYLLGFVTGIIFLNLDPYDKDEFVRFHARQSIVFSVAVFVLWVIFSVFMAVLPGGLSSFLWVVWRVIAIVLACFWIFLMYKAYTGERYRIPELSNWAETLGF
jgi:uncharacterized membrane protein